MSEDGIIDWSKIDWVKVGGWLYARLRIEARFMPDVFNCGVSPEDIVGETFATFFRSKNALGWNPQKGSLEAFLWGVAHNKLRDHIRRARKIVGSFDDPDFFFENDDDLVAKFIERIALLKADARGDKKMEAVIDAAAQTNEAGNTNQQLADITGYSVAEIVEIKRRIRRRMG